VNDDLVALGGTMYSNSSMAIRHEIIRKGKRDLTITRNMCGFECDLQMASGEPKKFITASFSIRVPCGASKILKIQ
jgi:acyl CoA:acetate/3-ketoacid CoA transferase alpha subunit